MGPGECADLREGGLARESGDGVFDGVGLIPQCTK